MIYKITMTMGRPIYVDLDISAEDAVKLLLESLHDVTTLVGSHNADALVGHQHDDEMIEFFAHPSQIVSVTTAYPPGSECLLGHAHARAV